MDSFQISILILQIVNIIFSICVGPLVTAFVEFSRRIERSNCCGSSVELSEPVKSEILQSDQKNEHREI